MDRAEGIRVAIALDARSIILGNLVLAVHLGLAKREVRRHRGALSGIAGIGGRLRGPVGQLVRLRSDQLLQVIRARLASELPQTTALARIRHTLGYRVLAVEVRGRLVLAGREVIADVLGLDVAEARGVEVRAVGNRAARFGCLLLVQISGRIQIDSRKLADLAIGDGGHGAVRQIRLCGTLELERRLDLHISDLGKPARLDVAELGVMRNELRTRRPAVIRTVDTDGAEVVTVAIRVKACIVGRVNHDGAVRLDCLALCILGREATVGDGQLAVGSGGYAIGSAVVALVVFRPARTALDLGHKARRGSTEHGRRRLAGLAARDKLDGVAFTPTVIGHDVAGTLGLERAAGLDRNGLDRSVGRTPLAGVVDIDVLERELGTIGDVELDAVEVRIRVAGLVDDGHVVVDVDGRGGGATRCVIRGITKNAGIEEVEQAIAILAVTGELNGGSPVFDSIDELLATAGYLDGIGRSSYGLGGIGRAVVSGGRGLLGGRGGRGRGGRGHLRGGSVRGRSRGRGLGSLGGRGVLRGGRGSGCGLLGGNREHGRGREGETEDHGASGARDTRSPPPPRTIHVHLAPLVNGATPLWRRILNSRICNQE